MVALATPTVAPGRVARRGNDARGLIGGLDHGYEEGLNADVEVLLDELARPVHRPHDGLYRIGSDGLQLRKHGAHIVWRVLRVEAQPVETNAGQELRNGGVDHADPQPDLRLTCAQRLLESVVRHLHGRRPQVSRKVTLPKGP